MPLLYTLSLINDTIFDGFLRLVLRDTGMVEIFAGEYKLQIGKDYKEDYGCRLYQNGEYKTTQGDMTQGEVVDMMHDITDNVFLVDYAEC